MDYQNTFFDIEPCLDICNPSKAFKHKADILISSDVMEHVMSPFEKAFIGTFDVLKPGGYVILTTPYFHDMAFVDKYPWMKSYKVNSNHEVTGYDGEFDRLAFDPIFHGGPGNTLEMRLFTPETLLYALEKTGFVNIQFLEDDIPEYGIVRHNEKMGTIIAKRPERSQKLMADNFLKFMKKRLFVVLKRDRKQFI
jgi:SAM-dependent methyltransferase